MRFLITGGSRGIGAQIVSDVAAAGHDVAFTYFSGESAASLVLEGARRQAPGQQVEAYCLDVRLSEQVASVCDHILDDFGSMDVVVCNAGVSRVGLAALVSDDDWNDVLATNLTGAFYVCRHFLQPFLAQGRGRFILISSVGMHGVSGQVAYSASKAGMMGLAQGLAKEYGPKGITANGLVLGLFDTALSRENLSERGERFWLENCPARRKGKLSEASGAVLFLASETASFVNGQMLGVNGGLDWVF
ncbi:MAG: SDR family oxidoreductase [Gammaproteobacteria bacterium]